MHAAHPHSQVDVSFSMPSANCTIFRQTLTLAIHDSCPSGVPSARLNRLVQQLCEEQLHHHVVGFTPLRSQADNGILPALLTLVDLHLAQQCVSQIRAHMSGHLIDNGEAHGGGDAVLGEVVPLVAMLPCLRRALRGRQACPPPMTCPDGDAGEAYSSSSGLRVFVLSSRTA